ncbi:diphthine--ammonia ligase [Chloroflexota bacterium]
MKPKVFASWSGGKDGCLSCYRALRNGLDVRYLANMVTGDGERSCSHGLASEVLRIQSRAMGIPLIQRQTTRSTYEAEFKDVIQSLKREEITGGVFGDIDFNEHRQWIDRVCRDMGITPYLPLWEERQEKLIQEFIAAGFVSVVVSAKADFFDQDILGQTIDPDFVRHLEEIGRTKDITLCGEAGEYHTLVVDGPLFQQRLVITEAEKVSRNGVWFLEISGVTLENK